MRILWWWSPQTEAGNPFCSEAVNEMLDPRFLGIKHSACRGTRGTTLYQMLIFMHFVDHFTLDNLNSYPLFIKQKYTSRRLCWCGSGLGGCIQWLETCLKIR